MPPRADVDAEPEAGELDTFRAARRTRENFNDAYEHAIDGRPVRALSITKPIPPRGPRGRGDPAQARYGRRPRRPPSGSP